MSNNLYILDGEGNCLLEDDYLKWVEWCGNIENRRVDFFENDRGSISTVFLGMDHNFSGEGDPVLWESLFYIDNVEYIKRYTSRKEAEEFHERVILILKGEKENDIETIR